VRTLRHPQRQNFIHIEHQSAPDELPKIVDYLRIANLAASRQSAAIFFCEMEVK